MASLAEKAEEFRRLHHQPRPLVLPNAWDVPSARIFEETGFPAVATSSAALMVANGYPDGQEMPRRELVRVTGTIARSVSVPLSADLVAGYGRGPQGVVAAVRQISAAGAVGINLEDRVPGAERLFPLPAQVRKIRAIREWCGTAGRPLVINGRTDALRVGTGSAEERMREAIRRGLAYRDAGADCLYPMGLTEAGSIEQYVRAVEFPVNVMVRAGLPPISELERMGVKRVSFGPAAAYATLGFLRRAAADAHERGAFDSLIEGAISHDELNRLARPRPAAPTSTDAAR